MKQGLSPLFHYFKYTDKAVVYTEKNRLKFSITKTKNDEK